MEPIVELLASVVRLVVFPDRPISVEVTLEAAWLELLLSELPQSGPVDNADAPEALDPTQLSALLDPTSVWGSDAETFLLLSGEDT